MPHLQPNYKDVQAHYDLSNEFFALFLDPSMMYSCAYFPEEDMSLEEAQRVKTLAEQGASVEFRLQGWEEFDEPVDRIVSIGAFEHFRKTRYEAFFAMCRRVLPDDGTMMLHSIVTFDPRDLEARGITIRHEDVLFGKFIQKHIFPGGQLCPAEVIERRAEAADFEVVSTQALCLHYARTLDLWAANLAGERDRAIELTSVEVFDTYMRYLTGCADAFRAGHLDVVQFTLRAR